MKGEGRYPELLKRLLSELKCPVCKASYKGGDFNLVTQQGEMWVIRVRCPRCGVEGVIFAMVSEGKTSTGELTPAEVKKFKKMPPISADEVLETYEFLKGFQGDFTELLGG